MIVNLYIKPDPEQPSIEDYTLEGDDDDEDDKRKVNEIQQFEEQHKIIFYGIYNSEKEAEKRKEELQFEQVQYNYEAYDYSDRWYSTITLDIFIKKESAMYIVYKTIHYDIQQYSEQFYGEPFMFYLEDVWSDEYTFHKKIRVNKPINITFQIEEDGLITEIVSHKSKTQLGVPFWTPTHEFHSLLGAHRIMGPVFTIMLIDWRLQCQDDSELATKHTTQIALPTLPTEIWMEILRMLRIRDFGAPLF